MPKNYRSKTLNKDKTKNAIIKYPKKHNSGKNKKYKKIETKKKF